MADFRTDFPRDESVMTEIPSSVTAWTGDEGRRAAKDRVCMID